MTLNWKGIFRINVEYDVGDVVYFRDDGFTYVCIKKSVGFIPPRAFGRFELLAGFNINTIDGGIFDGTEEF